MVAHVRVCTAIRVNIPSHFCVETSYSRTEGGILLQLLVAIGSGALVGHLLHHVVHLLRTCDGRK